MNEKEELKEFLIKVVVIIVAIFIIITLLYFTWEILANLIGTIIGIAINVATSTLVSIGLSPGWIVFSTISLSIGSLSVGFYTLKQIYKGVQEKPFAWLFPILSILAGFIASSFKELIIFTEDSPYNGFKKEIFGLSITLFYFLGGTLWQIKKTNSKFLSRLSAILCFIFPPMWIFYLHIKPTSKSLFDASIEILTNNSFEFIFFGVFIGLFVLLSYIYKEDEY